MENHRSDDPKNEAGELPPGRPHVQLGLRGLHDGIAGMATLPLEDQAHLMFSTIAHAAMECMGEATVLVIAPEEAAESQPPPWQRTRSRQPRAKEARRYAELHHLARLSEAGSRLLDAYTRLKNNNRALTLHSAHRARQEDGSILETRLSYRASAPVAALAAETEKEEQIPPAPPAQ